MGSEGAGLLARPMVVGMTGGIGCGKSTAAGFLGSAGIDVLEADTVAHEAMRPGGEAYDDVVEAFGQDIVAGDGKIDRRALGRVVFGCSAAMRLLNALVHPRVRERWETWEEDLRRENRCGIVVIPLLYEAGYAVGWDAVLCVAASPDVVKERLTQRGWTEEEIRQRLAAQWPVEEKVRRADAVIWNNGTLQELKARTLAAWRQVSGGE